MNISRKNYEEIFFDYLEGNLTSAEKKEVETFVSLNADLAGELDAFRETIQVPDQSIVFERKASLKKEEGNKVWILFRSYSLYVAAAALLLFTLITFLNRPGTTDSSPVVASTNISSDGTQKNNSPNNLQHSDIDVNSTKNQAPQPVVVTNFQPGNQPVYDTANSRFPGTNKMPGNDHSIAETLNFVSILYKQSLVVPDASAFTPVMLAASFNPPSVSKNNASGYTSSKWLAAAGSVASDIYHLSGRTTTAFNDPDQKDKLSLNSISVDLGFIKYFHHYGEMRK